MQYLVIIKLNTGGNLVYQINERTAADAIRNVLFKLTDHQSNMVTSVEVIEIHNDIEVIK